jgi:hypothetical protein
MRQLGIGMVITGVMVGLRGLAALAIFPTSGPSLYLLVGGLTVAGVGLLVLSPS